MARPARTLGTLLRHLIELLDGAVEQTYRDAELDYRPRYTPVLRALIARGPGMRPYLANPVNVLPGAVAEINVAMLVDTATEDRSGRAVP